MALSNSHAILLKVLANIICHMQITILQLNAVHDSDGFGNYP